MVLHGLGWPGFRSASKKRAASTEGLGWPQVGGDAAVSVMTEATPDEPVVATPTADGGLVAGYAPRTVDVSRETSSSGDEGRGEARPTDAGLNGAAERPDRPVAPDIPDVAAVLLAPVPALEDLPVLVDTPSAPMPWYSSLHRGKLPVPPHTRVVTIANQKGGVGKTTTTVNIAAALAQSGLSVLVLDMDPQGNASTALGVDHGDDVPSLYDVVVEGRPLADVVRPCPDVANLTCAPATVDLAGAEIELVSMVARETRLRRAVDTFMQQRLDAGLPRLDYILIDCPPSLGLLTVNAFVAAREVLIPIQCEYYALEGLSQLLKNVQLIQSYLNPELVVSTILLTMYDGRTRLSAQVADEVRAHFSREVLKTTVPRSVRISEAPSHGQTVMTYDPASSGAFSYLEAARELAEQVVRSGDESSSTREGQS